MAEHRSADGTYVSGADLNKWDHYWAAGFQARFYRAQPRTMTWVHFEDRYDPCYRMVRVWRRVLGITWGWIGDFLRSAS